jgi:hypothetical protein
MRAAKSRHPRAHDFSKKRHSWHRHNTSARRPQDAENQEKVIISHDEIIKALESPCGSNGRACPSAMTEVLFSD